MADQLPTLRAATIQAAPVYHNREATVAKACRLIEEAAADGNRLIVFPEAWVPTFPYWPRALSHQALAPPSCPARPGMGPCPGRRRRRGVDWCCARHPLHPVRPGLRGTYEIAGPVGARCGPFRTSRSPLTTASPRFFIFFMQLLSRLN